MRDKVQLFGTVSIGLMALTAISSITGFTLSARRIAALDDYRIVTSDIRNLRLALIDAETGAIGYAVTGNLTYVQSYFEGLAKIDALSPAALHKLDEEAESFGVGGPRPLSRRVSDMRRIWNDAVSEAQQHHRDAAAQELLDPGHKQAMKELRQLIEGVVSRRSNLENQAAAILAYERMLMLGVESFGALVAIVALLYFFRRSMSESRRREAAMAESAAASRRVEYLFGMASTLQSATDRDDANQVLCAAATRLLPGFGGLLYLFNHSRDRLDLSAAWGTAKAAPPLEHIMPASCWAMKRGKTHRNDNTDGAPRCDHLSDPLDLTLEIPIAVRGQEFGLLLIRPGDHGRDAAALTAIQPTVAAMAEAMSLAYSSIAMRDMLRNQALRDPLTGLYNRRFMDEMLEHLCMDARRRKSTVSAIMIDLDYFKQLNDQFGHAVGDSVLRAVAGVVVHTLRATDVACRYGGEELAILLPDCPFEMAVLKAEQLRSRIAEVAVDPSGAVVTASLGVAAIPDTSATSVDLLAHADAALYRAKLKGRNRVERAESSASPEAEPIQQVI